MIVLDSVSYRYPYQEQDAVSDFSLRIKPGEAVLITGASGCGKSTIVRLINGLCPHYFKGRMSGEVRINGSPNAARSLHEISADVGTLFQDPEHQFFAMTVEDELAFVHEWRETSSESVRAKVLSAATQFGLGPLLKNSIHHLSEGQKQKVVLASVLSQTPRVLVLDEPTANLDPESTADLAVKIAELKKAGMAIVVVDHRLYWLEGVADSVLVMDRGRIVAGGKFSILTDTALRDSCGLRKAHVPDIRPQLISASRSEGILRVDGLSFGYRGKPDLFRDVSFALPRGVAGILGDNGSGKTTLARLLTGLIRMRAGRVFFCEERIAPQCLLDQSSLVLQNADHQLHMKTVEDELTMSVSGGRKNGTPARVEELLRGFGLEEKRKRHPQSLSGGEKQRLVVACALAKNPKILLLDEPTSGLDGRNMARISESVRNAAAAGASVMIISHDLELMSTACNCALNLPFQTPSSQEK